MLSIRTPLKITCCLIAVLACAASAGTSGVSSGHSGAKAPHLPSHTAINPHLHLGPKPAAADKLAHDHRVAVGPRVTIVSRHAWHPAWDARAYIVQQRGLATVHGIVHNAAGQPIAGARVALRGARGRIFRKAAYKHTTYTNANGEFLMTSVRPGAYRAYAYLANKQAFTHFTADAGSLARLQIKL